MARALPLQNIDPSIQNMAVALVCEFMAYIEAGLFKGGHFYTLRDRFLERNADEWVRLYGKECADKAARGIYALEEDECLSPEAKRVLAKRWKEDRLKNLRELDPGRDNALNRWFVRWLGVRLY